MAKTVVIGCRLPNGLILQHPTDPKQTVRLNGLNSSRVIGATYVSTPVDADFWESWKLFHKDFAPLTSNSIFEASGAREADDKAKELAGEKTGLERLNPTDFNVKPAEKED